MICNKCGMQNNDSSKFCINCGNVLEVVEQPKVEPLINQFNDLSTINNQSVVNTDTTMNNTFSNQSVINNSFEQQINNVSGTSEKNKKENKPLNKKLLLIIGVIIIAVIVVAIFIVVMLGGNKSNKNLISTIDLDQPIPVYKDGSYVYIDKKGKIIKNIKYIEASDFSGDYAFVELEDGTSALIDKNQNIKVKATSYYGMEYITEYNLWLIDGILYNGDLKAITDNSINLDYDDDGFFIYNNSDYSEYGIINKEGKKIYKNKCLISSLDVNDYSNGDEYYGVVETTCYEGDVEKEKEFIIELQTGKVLYENKYKDQYPDSYYYYLQETYDNMFYVIDENYEKLDYMYLKNNQIVYLSNEKLYDLELYGNDYLKLDYGYSYEELGKPQRDYYYDINNKKILSEEPKIEEIDIEAPKIVTERQIVSCDYGKGLIDDKKVIIPCIYDDIDSLPEIVHEYLKVKESKDLVYVENYNGEIIVYDANSRKEFIKLETAEDYDIDDYPTSVLIKQKIYVEDSYDVEKTIVYSLLNGQKIVFDSNSDIEIKSNYFIESKNGKKIYYNLNFEKIYTEG